VENHFLLRPPNSLLPACDLVCLQLVAGEFWGLFTHPRHGEPKGAGSAVDMRAVPLTFPPFLLPFLKLSAFACR
jgi:hypothetical protein